MAFVLNKLLLVGAVVPGLAMAGFTSDRLKNQSIHELAAELLGLSGASIVDLDRPSYSLGPLTFYGKAKVLGSQFGLCGATRATVKFDDTGEVNELLSETRYGVAGNIYAKPRERSASKYESICSSVASTRKFFPAPDAQSALQIAQYADAISGEGPFASQNFAFSCSGACLDGKASLKWLKLEEIDSAVGIPCPGYEGYQPACYQITVGNEYAGLFPKTFSIFGNFADGKPVITAVSVSVGSTLAAQRPNNSFKPTPLRGAA